MATANDQTSLLALRQGLSKLLDQLTAVATEIAGASPSPDAIAAATKIMGQLGFAPPDSAAQDDPDEEDDSVDADGVPLSPEKRAAKRERRAFNKAFSGMGEQITAKRLDQPGVWDCNDMSSPEAGERAIKKALGKHAPKRG